MGIERVAITGCSGFYGRAVIAALRRRCSGVEILGLDVVPPQDHPPDQFVRCDVLSQEFAQHVAEFSPDTVIHLAFIVNPIRDEERMHTVNVRGTEAVLQATAAAQAQRLLVASSATAYGAWPDNPVPMTEEQPLRPRAEYRYADDKVKVEQLLEAFAQQHSDIAVSWTRPCMIYGPGLSNYLTEFILNGPLIALPGFNDTQLQFIHVDDVADGSVSILQADARGPFNLAPDDWFTLSELAQWSGRRCVGVPLAACLLFTKIWWGLRLPWFSFPSGLWYFIRYPWVVSPARMERELNFRCRMSSREVVMQLLQDAGQSVMQPVFAHELPEQAGTAA